ncbi:hemolysin family protein [Flammeovirga kamogawensis]|uniref:Hemolysin family protein n=1 Tax=Flammeovirga kamogawensis TaxID=373891 RepID=A0ABX8GPZ4_9BACT|nr:hemolysin family protein [Flammeovirga kamogawensis]MBB6463027.1 CBS domain containing-hemolysin-like protein [Flammeovirga kamogawensis]QWG05664.1 hemolysin family protein [Flammeovirga kamogawensis]TRX67494.1 HlyC/CorC family transporter [Flammeovirga kamogawensis]
MNENIIYIGLCLLFSAFFSATEIAFVSANRLHIEVQRTKDSFTGRLINKFFENKSTFITTILIGNTSALVMYGIFVSNVLDPVLQAFFIKQLPTLDSSTLEISVLISQTVLSTIVVLITAEFLPKSLTMLNPDVFLNIAAPPMNVIYIVMYPITWVVEKLSQFTIRYLMGIKSEEKETPFNLTDLGQYIQEIDIASQDDDDTESESIDKKFFENALEFKEVRARDVMIPRKEVVALDIEEDIDALKKLFIESGHSKIPIYRDDLDNIIGYCHARQLFKKPQKIEEIIHEMPSKPETAAADEMMAFMMAEQKSMVCIIDEYGGTAGIATLEDITEEIVGEIEDEHDEEDLPFFKEDENTFLLTARHEIDLLNEKYGWNIEEEGEYDTLGGYILYHHRNIPSIDEEIDIDGYIFDIVTMDGARIDMVRVHFPIVEED